MTVNDRQMLKQRTFLAIAVQLGALSTCPRKAVGALIVKNGRCISWGYNGAPPGTPHCEENNHGYGNVMDAGFTLTGDFLGCRNATHAEANALAFAARQGISTDGATLFVTVSPCATCARLLIAAGINRVVALEYYRDHDGDEVLSRAGIHISLMLPH